MLHCCCLDPEYLNSATSYCLPTRTVVIVEPRGGREDILRLCYTVNAMTTARQTVEKFRTTVITSRCKARGRCDMRPSRIITDKYHKNETLSLVKCILDDMCTMCR